MNPLSRFEKLAEQLVEGSFGRWFAGQLHPLEVALQLARAKDLIEQASGRTYADFIQENIFAPLNMHDSGYENHSTGGAVGYRFSYDTTGAEYTQWPISNGEGNLYSTTARGKLETMIPELLKKGEKK